MRIKKPLSIGDQKIKAELEAGKYDKYIKSKCCICNTKIPKTREYYRVYGNICLSCNRRIVKKVKEILNNNFESNETNKLQ